MRQKMQHQGEIPLSNPLITQEQQFEMRELNILQTDPDLQDKFQVIRAANVLNLQYFTTDQLTTILKELHGYLKTDGLLMVCRNVVQQDNKEEAHGTLYQKNKHGFVSKDDFGQGSEINATILAVDVKQE